MGKQGYHHGNLREALIEAALSLIEEAEPFHFTLRQAASRAGVAASAPYRHFANKAALMTALAEEGVEKLFGLMGEEMAGVEAPEERFRAMGIAFVKFAMAYPGYFRVLYMPEGARPSPSESLSDSLRSNTQLLSGLFEEMGAAGSVSPGLSPIQLLAAQAMTYGLARMFVDGQLAHLGLGIEDIEPLTRAMTDVLGHGLAPRTPVQECTEEPEASPSEGLARGASTLTPAQREALLKKLAPLFSGSTEQK